MPASMSPAVSCSARLQSIIPAPVISRSSLTSWAVTSAMVLPPSGWSPSGNSEGDDSNAPQSNSGFGGFLGRFLLRLGGGVLDARLPGASPDDGGGPSPRLPRPQAG